MVRDGELEELGVRLVDEAKTDVVRPNDTMIIRLKRHISMQEHHDLMDYLRDMLPGTLNFVVISGVDEIRVFRPEGGEM